MVYRVAKEDTTISIRKSSTPNHP